MRINKKKKSGITSLRIDPKFIQAIWRFAPKWPAVRAIKAIKPRPIYAPCMHTEFKNESLPKYLLYFSKQ